MGKKHKPKKHKHRGSDNEYEGKTSFIHNDICFRDPVFRNIHGVFVLVNMLNMLLCTAIMHCR